MTPHVFISAASDDLRSSRRVVRDALLTVGCHPIVQEHFEPDYRTVRDMIHGRLADCHAMIHLVGKRYGGEPSPASLPPGEKRRSWTQLERHLAEVLGLKTFLFLCSDEYPYDRPDQPEPEDEVRLQETYRREIRSGDQLYVVVGTREELALRVSEMKLQAAELRAALEAAEGQLTGAVAAVESSAAELRQGQDRILDGLADLSESFSALAGAGGILPDPSTPEQFYHNARLFELKGDFGNARRAYLEYLRFGLDFVDPHLRFQQFLKVQEGREGAREVYEAIASRSPGTIPRLAASLLWDREIRVARIEKFLETHPDFGPAYYLLSRDFSAERLGSQTLRDKRQEMALLERFGELDGKGKVVRWLLDQSEVAEWRDDAASRLAALESSRFSLENPLSIYWMSHNTGWTGTIQIAEMAREILWRPPGQPEFVSTGFAPGRSYSNGLPHPLPNIELPRDAPAGVIEVKYRDIRGEESPIFALDFSPETEVVVQAKHILGVTRTAWISFREWDGARLVYFTHLLSYRKGLREIRWGVDREIPDRTFPLPPSRGSIAGPAPIGEDMTIYEKVPSDCRFVSVEVTFRDGEKSGIQVFRIEEHRET